MSPTLALLLSFRCVAHFYFLFTIHLFISRNDAKLNSKDAKVFLLKYFAPLRFFSLRLCVKPFVFLDDSKSNRKFVNSNMQYFKAGKLVAVHGLKGELIFKHGLGKKTSLKDLKAIFIEDRKDSFLPWFIETAKARSADEVLLKLETIDTREAAAKISQKEIWITEEDFKRLSAKSAPANLLGYTIINNKERLSEVLEVIEQPHQLLCRIELNKKEVLIPINEHFLKKIDHKKKEVIVELPEGLIDVYL